MNDLRSLLEDSVNRVLKETLSWENLGTIEETSWSQDLWENLKEIGVPYLFLGENEGGINGIWSDAYVVLRACGRYAAPVPIPEAMLANWYARQAGLTLPEDTWAVIDNEMEWPTVDKVAFQDLSVPWGRRVKNILAIDSDELKLIELENASISEKENIGRDPRDLISGTGNLINSAKLNLVPDSYLYLGALIRSAQISGAASMAFDLAITYSADREQFGRPLSKFQTIQHYLADLAGMIASVDAVTLAACQALDEFGLGEGSSDTLKGIAAAKCRASDAVEKITRLSHQIHGAIGFTYEYGLHYVTRRLWAWRSEFGSSNYWGRYLGNLAIEAGDDGVWSLVTK